MIKTLKENNIVFLIFIFNQLCSIRFFLNSSFFGKDINFFILYVIISFFIFFFLFHKKIIDFFLSDKFFYFVLFILFIFLIYIYPIQDNLKYNLQGSDQDNCYVDILDNIINNKINIYSNSYLGNPCSTGLMAFLFYFPLIIWKNYFSIIPIIFLLLFKFSNQYFLKEKKTSNLFTLILMCNLVFLELSVSGSDFISISISYVIANIFLLEGLKKKNKLMIFSSFIFFLFFFGSRSILIILAFPLMLIFYNKFKNINVLIFFILVFCVSLASYLIPYILLLPNYFPPFHLIGKAYWYFDNIKYLMMIILFISFLIRKKILEILNYNFLLFILLIIVCPLLLSSFSGFIYNIGDLSKWEELNYIYIFTPSLFTFLYALSKKN